MTLWTKIYIVIHPICELRKVHVPARYVYEEGRIMDIHTGTLSIALTAILKANLSVLELPIRNDGIKRYC